MKLEQWKIDRLVPYPGNPRNNESAVDRVAESLRLFGWKQPIVVDSCGVVVAGHTRLLAAKALGMDRVPVLVAKDLSPEQVAAYRLVDNRTADFAEWDPSSLDRELGLVSGIDLSSFNFDEILDGIKTRDEELPDDGGVDANAAEEMQNKWGTESGQLWSVGDHRIICGDSTDPLVVDRLLAGAKPQLMVTDPPYGVEYDPAWRAEAGTNNNKKKMGKVLNDDVCDWTAAWRLFPGDIAYVYHAGVKASTVQASLEKCGFVIRAQIIWAKDRMALSRGDYHWQHEPCWFAVKHESVWYAVREKKPGLRTDDRTQTTLWDIPARDDDGCGHGTQKPIECMARPIRNHECAEVYEPFSGSGTTLIACEHLRRKCYAVELSPGYVAIALQRWTDLTGKTPTVIS